MSLYLIQAAYTPEALRAMLQNPQDRTNVVRAPIEALGGKVHSMYFSFGEYDAVLLLEMPNNVAAAAIAMAFASGGACKTIKTTPLMTTAEGLEAFKQAGRSGYQPTLASARAAS
ncbi:MAG: GYD domain-containing protein [Candidatus Acidiferrales bacterium]